MSLYEPQFPLESRVKDTNEIKLAPAVLAHERMRYARSTSKDSIAVTPIVERDQTYLDSRGRALPKAQARPGFRTSSKGTTFHQPISGMNALLRAASALNPTAGGPPGNAMSPYNMASDAVHVGTKPICHKRKATTATTPETIDHFEPIGTSV